MRAVWTMEVVWGEIFEVLKERGKVKIDEMFDLMEERGVQGWQTVEGLLWAIRAGLLKEGDDFVYMEEE